MSFLIFIFGLFLLLQGANFLIDGSLSLGTRFKISSVVLGLTMVAFGTSAPELAVILRSVYMNESEVAMIAIFASSILNIFLVLGLYAIFSKVVFTKRIVHKEVPYNIVIALVLVFLLNDFGTSSSILTFADGMILLLLFAYFLRSVFLYRPKFLESHMNPKIYSIVSSTILIISGIAALLLGSRFVLDAIVSISNELGLSKRFLSATMVAFGTSLPELFTAIVALRKKHADLLLGNLVGSNIFNLCFILGIAALFKPIAYDVAWNIDLWWMVWSKVLLLIFLIQKPKYELLAWQGYMFLVMFLVYGVILFM